jgi:hypothetical protein
MSIELEVVWFKLMPCFHFRTDFDTFVREKTAMLTSNRLKVASASGIGIEINEKLILAFLQLGMEILGMNQCKDAEFDSTKSLEFLRGGLPTWELFRYNENGNF